MSPRSDLQEVTLTVDAETVRAYAELTQDFNPIHLDPDFARQTPVGGVIAHGTMSICLLWQSVEQTFGALDFTDLRLDIRFASPVYLGEVITASGRLQEGAVGCYDVWVRGQDGRDRIAGVLKIHDKDEAAERLVDNTGD
ncbi:MaoC family dehydratase [Pollutimonas harenae]|uniref:MaoC family dehydratase n=1 Tax=Pollutimonas harenae TaxID=657015 RepID=A0A853GPQ3_9BURK|nr:MaoC family dehydratase [Pollutimonas harenae]NYT84147.1 MaoC family dehydratase [Pollutimonas harenae]TEA73437.1 acyl dehydratase [Pollutimonas harenae]